MSDPEIKKAVPPKLAPAEAVDLLGLLQVQNGAVVSREVARSPGGTVTVFAFDGGQGLSEHTAPFDALVQVLDGQVELTVGGKKVVAGPGQMVRMPAQISHALLALTPFKMLLIMLKGE